MQFIFYVCSNNVAWDILLKNACRTQSVIYYLKCNMCSNTILTLGKLLKISMWDSNHTWFSTYKEAEMEFKVENFQDMFFMVLLSRGTIFWRQYYGEFKRSSEIRLLQEI